MSIWTSLRDSVIKPAASMVADFYYPGAGQLLNKVMAPSGGPSAAAPVVPQPNPAVNTIRKGVGMSAYGTGKTIGTAVGRALPNVARALPGVGTAIAVGTAASAVYDWATAPSGRRVRINPRTGMPVRRTRSKGITGRELKSFTRVTHILNKYCKAAPPRRRAAPSKGKACR